jgi:hypothetical protein
MPFTQSAVELFISARAAAVTSCGASDMKAKVPESAHWLSNFGLNVIFNDFPTAETRPLIINFIRRIYCAFLEYDLARQEVLKLVKDGHGRWSPYFAALNNFEITVAQLYIALDSVRKHANHNFFKTGDESFEECLNLIYNASKHQLAGSELPVWFTNEGLACAQATLTFAEVEDFMLKMSGVVKGFCNRDIALQALQSNPSFQPTAFDGG